MILHLLPQAVVFPASGTSQPAVGFVGSNDFSPGFVAIRLLFA
jgi:hypothetical protein